MKKLIMAAILITTISGTSSVSVQVAMYPLRPAIANNLDRGSNRCENHISDLMKSGLPDQFVKLNNNGDEQEIIDRDFLNPEK